jgi:hypothetical protein
VDVCVHFGPTILERVPELAEGLIHRIRITGGDSARCRDQEFALPAGVLMKNENRKNVAEEKTRSNQSYAPENVEAARAHCRETVGESRCELVRSSRRRRTHRRRQRF